MVMYVDCIYLPFHGIISHLRERIIPELIELVKNQVLYIVVKMFHRIEINSFDD
jgi:hypothetical protein